MMALTLLIILGLAVLDSIVTVAICFFSAIKRHKEFNSYILSNQYIFAAMLCMFTLTVTIHGTGWVFLYYTCMLFVVCIQTVGILCMYKSQCRKVLSTVLFVGMLIFTIASQLYFTNVRKDTDVIYSGIVKDIEDSGLTQTHSRYTEAFTSEENKLRTVYLGPLLNYIESISDNSNEVYLEVCGTVTKSVNSNSSFKYKVEYDKMLESLKGKESYKNKGNMLSLSKEISHELASNKWWRVHALEMVFADSMKNGGMLVTVLVCIYAAAVSLLIYVGKKRKGIRRLEDSSENKEESSI